MDSLLQIHLLGEFSVGFHGTTLRGGVGRGKKVWTLIAYLVANRGKEISQERLMEELLPDEEYDDPAHILKNLVYRARMALKDVCPELAQDLIHFEHNTYIWNTQIPCVIDTVEFESLLNEAAASAEAGSADSATVMEKQLAAFHLYTGEFLPGFSYMEWVISKSAYYATLYRRCTLELATRLIEAERAEEAASVCETAVSYYPFEEDIHRRLMEAYMAAGREKMAVTHYERINKRFYDEFGVSLSDETEALYKRIVKNMHNVEQNLVSIKEDLAETNRLQGAFSCDYTVFKNIYRLYARSMDRSGASIHIGLLTITSADGKASLAEVVKPALLRLRDCCISSLRKGDVVAIYSTSQLVLMLPYTTYENGCKVLERIVQRCRAFFAGNTKLQAGYMLRAIDPVDEP